MPSPLDVADLLADAVTAAGIRATTDPRNVVPPCVLFLPPDDVTLDIGCGGTATMRAVLLVPGPGQRDAWLHLDNTLGQVLDVLPAETIRSTTYEVDASGPMPAYEMTWTHIVDFNKRSN